MLEIGHWDVLCAVAQEKCDEILEKDVAPIVSSILLKSIQNNIYRKYTPVVYRRRNNLASESNIKTYLSEDGTLTVTSVAEPSPAIFKKKYNTPIYPPESRLLQWIEFGRVPNYFGASDGAWAYPRPAVAMAQKEINTSTAVKNAIKRGLNR